jgi:predicted dehydrogenase/threonine dehydrogenase-like Zn-dependent dehydrogenase
MKQLLVKSGKITVEEVPAPVVEAGTVLVEVDHSCISVGTELSGVRLSGLPLWKRVTRRPDLIRKVVKLATTHGLGATRSLVESKLSAEPLGSSVAGVVREVGEGVDEFQPGDRVACGGAQCAYHAELVRVPRNLVVPVPDGLDLASASTVTVGAIVLQGVRRAQPTLGETFVVIGLGVLGQLAVQLLKANGCRVIGTDLDRRRIELAVRLGLDVGVHPDDGHDVEQVARLTGGIGADGVLITAASPSDAVVSTAFRMCRKKGRVVLIGEVGLHLNRADFYAKELDFLISTSYGPGRYDNVYEEKGLDYPVAYVRWTEGRNMAEFVRLVAERKVAVAPLIAKTYAIEEAAAAYEALKSGAVFPPMVLLSYPRRDGEPRRKVTVVRPSGQARRSGQVRVAVIGAGAFAKLSHLPNLRQLSSDYHLRALASRTGHAVRALAEQFGADYATTDYQEVLGDPEVDAVLIATRHNLHAGMALEALRAGKHVLVEKPLALRQEELQAIEGFYAAAERKGPAPILLTGFNRRFSPHTRRIHELVAGRSNPMMVSYRMNAGRVPPESWLHSEEGGSRNLGEACHIYDLFTFLTNCRVARVTVQTIVPATGYYSRRDNFVATVAFEDGSVATLTYTALGAPEHPKEQMDLFVDGKVAVLDDYRRTSVVGAKLGAVTTKLAEKGHREELAAFAAAIRQGGEWPIPLWQQIQATEIALTVEDLLGSAR